MALSAVESVSCFNASGGGGGGVNYTWQRFPDKFHKVFVNNFGSEGLNNFKFWIQPGMDASLHRKTEAEYAVTSHGCAACVQADVDGCEME